MTDAEERREAKVQAKHVHDKATVQLKHHHQLMAALRMTRRTLQRQQQRRGTA